MSDVPDNLRYTKDHEWARLEEDGTIVVGITAHAVEQLGDITMVTLPEPGAEIEKDQPFGDVDSVKAVSELFAPLDAEVVEINDALEDEPEKVNDAPYDDGWMLKIQPKEAGQYETLLDAAAYRKLLADAE